VYQEKYVKIRLSRSASSSSVSSASTFCLIFYEEPDQRNVYDAIETSECGDRVTHRTWQQHHRLQTPDQRTRSPTSAAAAAAANLTDWQPRLGLPKAPDADDKYWSFNARDYCDGHFYTEDYFDDNGHDDNVFGFVDRPPSAQAVPLAFQWEVCVGSKHITKNTARLIEVHVVLHQEYQAVFCADAAAAADKHVFASGDKHPKQYVEEELDEKEIMATVVAVEIEKTEAELALTTPKTTLSLSSSQLSSSLSRLLIGTDAVVWRGVPVNSLADALPNVSYCNLTSSPALSWVEIEEETQGLCSLRAAVETCLVFLRSYNYTNPSTNVQCSVLLPPDQTIVMDPSLSEILISDGDLHGTLSVEGNGCVIQPNVSSSMQHISSMRFLHINLPLSSSSSSFAFQLSNVTLTKFGDASLEGGALRVRNLQESHVSHIVDVLFEGNIGSDGGAISITNSQYMSLLRCVFQSNTAYEDGGGLFVDSDNEHINTSSCVFNHNRALGTTLYGFGGGVQLNARNSFILMLNCSLFNNSAIRAGGIGIFENNIEISFSDVLLLNNSAELYGGGMYISRDNL
jgi:hypothetical protein